MKDQRLVKIAVTGHVDHGKSTVIGRLLIDTNSLTKDQQQRLKKISKEFGRDRELAYLADQLKEERENNMTMDTTEIFLRGRSRDICLIDTPGHLEFIKNTLTGASHADAALVIVDAREGIRDQTRRHAYLIKLLSIPKVIVALTKMDLVQFKEEKFYQLSCEINDLFAAIELPLADIIPISAKESVNIASRSSQMKWFRGPTLLKAMEGINPHDVIDSQILRMPIQDVYPIEGENIAVGKIVTGEISAGQQVRIWPHEQGAKIETIKVLDQKKLKASSQESIGLVLSAAPEVKRGDVLFNEDFDVKPTRSFKANLFWMSDEPLQVNEKIIIRCGTQECRSKVVGIESRIDPATFESLGNDSGKLQKNEVGIILIKPLEPLYLEEFSRIEELGRYVVERQGSLQGAGTVVETYT